MAPALTDVGSTVEDVLTYILVFAVGLAVGGFSGFVAAAIMASAAHDEECSRCWSRMMRNVAPRERDQ